MPRQPKPTAASIKDRVVDFRRVPASDLLPNPKNFRLHNDAQRRIFREMLDRIGFAGAELTRELPDGRLMLIDGHMRQEELGDTPLPVLVTDLSEQEADALLATFDPLGRLAGTDTDAASALIESLGMAGYDAAADLLRAVADNDQTAALLESLADGMLGDEPDAHDVDDPGGGGDDFDTTPDEDGPTRCQSGDLWQLGAHRLLCGDSTKREDVARLMDGERASLMATDPPYGDSWVQKAKDMRAHGYGHSHAGLHGYIENDNRTGDDLAGFLGEFLQAAKAAGDPPMPFYVWHRAKRIIFEQALVNAGYFVHQPIVWVKPGFVIGRLHYHPRCEWALHGWRQGNGVCPFLGPRNQSDVWAVGRENDKLHPTQKPVALFVPPIENHTKPGDAIYEPFAGSGTQYIAAERTGRHCFGIEINPRYCDVILRRWEAETGREAALLSRISEPEHATTAEAKP